MIALGSSPLTRGKPSLVAYRLDENGLIPAHAGKTGASALTSGAAGAHPRSRGENVENLTPHALSIGSSPLTRGKRGHVARAAGEERLIPAHAGKTSRSRAGTPTPWAHPRSRGENSEMTVPAAFAAGSSPLTRGKQLIDGQGARLHRLIPAHAGKTSC